MNNKKIYILIGVLIAAVVVIAFFASQKSGDKKLIGKDPDSVQIDETETKVKDTFLSADKTEEKKDSLSEQRKENESDNSPKIENGLSFHPDNSNKSSDETTYGSGNKEDTVSDADGQSETKADEKTENEPIDDELPIHIDR